MYIIDQIIKLKDDHIFNTLIVEIDIMKYKCWLMEKAIGYGNGKMVEILLSKGINFNDISKDVDVPVEY